MRLVAEFIVAVNPRVPRVGQAVFELLDGPVNDRVWGAVAQMDHTWVWWRIWAVGDGGGTGVAL